MRKLGEKEILARLWKQMGAGDPRAWRDDCIITPIGGGRSLVYSLDRPEMIYSTGNRNTDLVLFGRWCAGLTANDVIACGVEPRGISFDVGVETVIGEELLMWARGVADVCEQYGMGYEGGNLGSGGAVTGMCFGISEDGGVIRRAGAQVGDYVVVTAALGTGWAQRVWRECVPAEPFPLPDIDEYKHRPWVNLGVFRKVWATGAINCGMDLTDGLVEFGWEIFEQSGCDVEFSPPPAYPDAVSLTARRLGLPEWSFLFEPGYDTPFAHGWCVAEGELDNVVRLLRQGGVDHLVVGRVKEPDSGPYVRQPDGSIVKLPRYWDDVNVHRGSVVAWQEDILPLFTDPGRGTGQPIVHELP
jgi:thiamine monophosphate kinase